jgi:hypothetical protein
MPQPPLPPLFGRAVQASAAGFPVRLRLDDLREGLRGDFS